MRREGVIACSRGFSATKAGLGSAYDGGSMCYNLFFQMTDQVMNVVCEGGLGSKKRVMSFSEVAMVGVQIARRSRRKGG